jgi:hypothetical protein
MNTVGTRRMVETYGRAYKKVREFIRVTVHGQDRRRTYVQRDRDHPHRRGDPTRGRRLQRGHSASILLLLIRGRKGAYRTAFRSDSERSRGSQPVPQSEEDRR